MISLTIAGQLRPLVQATLRRTAETASLSMQLVGPHTLAIGAAVSMVVSDGPAITGTISDSTSGARLTTATADVDAASGSGEYAPASVHFRSTGMIRGDLDFSILPGDTYAGIEIVEVTHTIGSSSASFTEARF